VVNNTMKTSGMVASLRLYAGLILFFSLGFSHQVKGEEVPSPDAIRKAVQKALPLLNTAANNSAKQRSCFTCHNQGLPILTFVEAQKRGFEIDVKNLNRQITHTAAYLKRGKNSYLKGIGQGGKVDAAGSALWALKAAGHERNEITDAVVDFILQWSDDTPHWTAPSQRPPSEGSRFTSTFLALSGLKAYSFDEKKVAIQKRREAARGWLIETQANTTEDQVFRLRAMKLAQVDEPQIMEAARTLLKYQRDDGGWAQLTDFDSDAYATGSALFALQQTGQIKSDSLVYQRGLKFLLDSQQKDGSWHVVSRSRPIQKYYESGFPHGKDQFISCSGTAWSTLALLQALPEVQ